MPVDTDRVEVYSDEVGGWRWRRVAANHRTLCSGESHTREADALRAAYRCCPDLDPAWAQPPRPADTTPLDLVNQMLGAADLAGREAARLKLEALLR